METSIYLLAISYIFKPLPSIVWPCCPYMKPGSRITSLMSGATITLSRPDPWEGPKILENSYWASLRDTSTSRIHAKGTFLECGRPFALGSLRTRLKRIQLKVTRRCWIIRRSTSTPQAPYSINLLNGPSIMNWSWPPKSTWGTYLFP